MKVVGSPTAVERQYLRDGGQLVSERSCAKLELDRVRRTRPGAIGARDSANDRRGILIAQRRLIILGYVEFFDAAPHGVGRHSGRAIEDGLLAGLKRGIILFSGGPP